VVALKVGIFTSKNDTQTENPYSVNLKVFLAVVIINVRL
jgi:hypothetical protein